MRKTLLISAMMAIAISSAAFAADTGPPTMDQGSHISNLGQPLAAHLPTFVAILASQPAGVLAQSLILTAIPSATAVATQQVGIPGGNAMAYSQSAVGEKNVIFADKSARSSIGGDKGAQAPDIVLSSLLEYEKGFAAG